MGSVGGEWEGAYTRVWKSVWCYACVCQDYLGR